MSKSGVYIRGFLYVIIGSIIAIQGTSTVLNGLTDQQKVALTIIGIIATQIRAFMDQSISDNKKSEQDAAARGITP